jgi:hypothetical protein
MNQKELNEKVYEICVRMVAWQENQWRSILYNYNILNNDVAARDLKIPDTDPADSMPARKTGEDYARGFILNNWDPGTPEMTPPGPKLCNCPKGTNHFNQPLVDGKCAKCGGV